MFRIMSYAFLILILLQYTTPRKFRPVKLWSAGFVEQYKRKELSYEDLPWNKTHAKKLKWKKYKYHSYEERDDYDLKLTLYCLNRQKEICALMDEYGNIAGIQVAIRTKYLKNASKFGNLKLFQRKNIDGKPHLTLTIYFVVQRTLRIGGRERKIKSLGIGLWIPGKNKIQELSPTEKGLLAQRFEKQTCVPGKGTYYLVSRANSMKCYLPYVPTVHDGYIVGMTFLVPCSKKSRKSKTSFKEINGNDFSELYPQAPQCLQNLAKAQKLCSAHVGFTKAPPNDVRCSKTLVEHIVDAAHFVLKKGVDFLG